MRTLRAMRALTLAALLFHATLLLRPADAFLIRPFIEDAFYSLTVSAWIADGKGMTIDGVNPTNGVQPLICFLYVPCFLVVQGDRIAALVPIMALQSIIFATAAFAIAWFTATTCRQRDVRGTVFWLSAMLIAWSIPLLNHMLNGLETGLAVAVAFGSTALYNKMMERPESRASRWLGLGALLGLAVLTRVDLAFLVVGVTGWHILRSGPNRKRRYAESALVGIAAIVVSSPWWVYNVVTFGSLMPISGQAQIALNTDRELIVMTTIRYMADAFVITTHLPHIVYEDYPWLGTVSLFVSVVLVLVTTRNLGALRKGFQGWRATWDPAAAVPVLAHALGLILYYSLVFGSPHFTSRYLVPWRILCSMAVVTLLYVVFMNASKPGRIGFALIVVAAMAVTINGFMWNFTLPIGNLYVARSDWINRNVAPNERVAMFQSGTTGFMCRNVVNLDGKVNADALRATQRGTMADYIIENRFDVLMDWRELVLPLMEDSRIRAAYQQVDSLSDGSLVFRRVRPVGK